MIDYSEIKGLDQDLKKVNEHIRRLCKSDDEVMQKMMDEVILAQENKFALCLPYCVPV